MSAGNRQTISTPTSAAGVSGDSPNGAGGGSTLYNETERALAGIALCADNEAALASMTAAGLKESDFLTPSGRIVLAAIEARRRGRPVDLRTIRDHLTLDTIEAAGGVSALHRLVDDAPPVAHAAYHIAALRETGSKRRLVAIGARLQEAAKNDASATDIISEMRRAIEVESAENNTVSKLDGYSLAALAESEIDTESILLGVDGVRYLCRGGTGLIVAPSGVGKSTASAQQDICWALGRPAFGITPARPLKIVTIQAENDRGDLIHMARGIMAAMSLDRDERDQVDAGTVYISHNASTGAEFLAFVDRVVQHHRPDMLRIDPLMAYSGGDLTKPETIANFCRNGLNRIATGRGIGIIVVHHTPKMTSNTANSQARKQWGAFDWQYSAAGGADLANWARAMLVIEPLSRDLFAFRAAKRWPGWRSDAGEVQHVRYFKRETEQGKVYWHDATPEDVATAGTQTAKNSDTGPDLESLQPTAAALITAPLSPLVFKEQLQRKLKLSKGKAETMLTMLTAEGGPLVRWKAPGWPLRHFVGTPAMKQRWENPAL